MHVLLTGAAGRLGRHTLAHLIDEGHRITAVDIVPLVLENPPAVKGHALVSADRAGGFVDGRVCDLTDWRAVERLFEGTNYDAVIHFGAIPSPRGLDPRVVHNTNVTGQYNVLQTAASHGVERIVSASSVNAMGLGYTPEGHKVLGRVPITEEERITCEDPYSLSKAEGELQASAICRYYPNVRIASLRFHMVVNDQATADSHYILADALGWVSIDACVSAAMLGITSTGWSGHEVFQIVAPTACYDWGTTDAGTEELLRRHWGDRIERIDSDWFKGDHRRSAWDCTKAGKLLGWKSTG